MRSWTRRDLTEADVTAAYSPLAGDTALPVLSDGGWGLRAATPCGPEPMLSGREPLHVGALIHRAAWCFPLGSSPWPTPRHKAPDARVPSQKSSTTPKVTQPPGSNQQRADTLPAEH